MILDKILRYLRERQVSGSIMNGTILDAGCGGEAHFLMSIKNRIKTGFGVDKKIMNAAHDNIQLFSLDLENDKLPADWNGYFDRVFMLASLEHFDRPEDVLKKIFDILKPDGKIYITTPSPVARPILNILALLRLIDPKEIKDHKHYFSKARLVSCMEGQGFRGIEYKYFESGFNQMVTAVKK